MIWLPAVNILLTRTTCREERGETFETINVLIGASRREETKGSSRSTPSLGCYPITNSLVSPSFVFLLFILIFFFLFLYLHIYSPPPLLSNRLPKKGLWFRLLVEAKIHCPASECVVIA